MITWLGLILIYLRLSNREQWTDSAFFCFFPMAGTVIAMVIIVVTIYRIDCGRDKKAP